MRLTGLSTAALALILGLLLCGCQMKGGKTAQTSGGQTAAGGSQANAPDAGASAGGQMPDGKPPLTPSGFTGDAKDFKYRDPSGAVHQLSEFAGQPIVVDFWAVW